MPEITENRRFEHALEQLVQGIVDEVKPLQILLFGSAARGELHQDSDLDLLIVMPEGAHRRRTAQRLYRTLKCVAVPFDLVVATPSDLEQHKDRIGLVYRRAMRDGQLIYAAR